MADSITEEYLVAGTSKEVILGIRETKKRGAWKHKLDKELSIFTSGIY